MFPKVIVIEDNMTKINLAVLFGGPSPEHEVSKASALNIFNNLDEKYNIIPIYISKIGQWFLYDGNLAKIPKSENIEAYCAEVVLSPKGLLRIVGEKVRNMNIDVVFPVLHGRYGEDGIVQGLLEANDMPYVGCGVFASSACMDKIHTKEVAIAAGVPCVKHFVVHSRDLKDADNLVKEIRATLGYPVFIKPSNTGSSVGISKAKNKKEVIDGLAHAFSFSDKVIIEKFVKAREIEVAVLGTGGVDTVATEPGEISQNDTFYTFEAKYKDPTSKNIIPANIDEEIAKLAKENAINIFKAVGGRGLARVDFFLEAKTNQLLLNEVNTMPGFTDISMYPQLIESLGISYSQLIDRLVEMALSGYKDNEETEEENLEKETEEESKEESKEVDKKKEDVQVEKETEQVKEDVE